MSKIKRKKLYLVFRVFIPLLSFVLVPGFPVLQVLVVAQGFPHLQSCKNILIFINWDCYIMAPYEEGNFF